MKKVKLEGLYMDKRTGHIYTVVICRERDVKFFVPIVAEE